MASAPVNPFKGLHPYEQKDREKLFGRDKDLVLMKDRIFSARTTLLFAGSGVGKTSFLNAKVIPEFKKHHLVFYHKEWSGKARPLDAVKKSLVIQSKLDQSACDLPLVRIVEKVIKAPADYQAAPGESDERDSNHCLIILDQFEEVFQYHAYEEYFEDFLNELCGILNDDNLRTRVVFSMREEFLGELSVFDNRIPDLFNNYYRLKYPDKFEAEDIIARTCGLADVSVDNDKLTHLVSDLSKIEKGAASFSERSTGGNGAKTRVIERNFIVPPYLQIACQRLWNKQFAPDRDGKAAAAPFLSGYMPHEVQATLQDFCNEKLSSLSFGEQRLAARSFGYLVTKQGAKMAYELSRLSEHMNVKQKKLDETLSKLSSYDTRILRVSRGPDGSRWFELYHDMYGTIVDRWRQGFQRRLRAWVMGSSIASSALIVILTLAIPYWILGPRSYKHALRDPGVSYVEANNAYKNLSQTWGYKSTADRLWAEYWDRRASAAEGEQSRDEALFLRLQALAAKPDDARRIEAGRLLGPYYDYLIATYRQEGAYPKALFSADGQFVLTQSITGNGEVTVRIWEADTGKLQGSPVILQSDFGSKPNTKSQSKSLDPNLDEKKEGEPQKPTPAAIDLSSRLRILGMTRHPQGGFLIGGIRTDQNSSKTNFILWRVNVGRISYTTVLSSALPDILSVAFSPDGQYIAFGRKNKTVSVWKLTDVNIVMQASLKHGSSVNAVTFSPDSKTLLTSDEDRVYLWDVQTAKMLLPPSQTSDYTRKVIFSPDGKLFLTYSDYSAQVWKTDSCKPVGEAIRTSYPLFAGFGPEGETVISMVRYGEVAQVWDSLSGKKLGTVPKALISYDPFTSRLGLPTIRPDGKAVLIMADDGTARLLNLDKLREHIAEYKIDSSSISSDGKTLVTLSSTGKIQLWNPDFSSETNLPVNSLSDNDVKARAVILSANGKSVAVVDKGNAVRVREVYSNQDMAVFTLGNISSTLSAIIPSAIIALSPDSKFLAAAEYYTDTLNLLNLANSALKISIRNFAASNLSFSPDSKHLIAASILDGGLRIYELPDGREIHINPNDYHKISVNAAAFTKDGRFITVSDDKTARVWELASGKLLKVLPHTTGVTALAISLDDKLALTADSDKIVHLWDIESGNEIITPISYKSPIRMLAFSRDGKAVVTLTGQWAHRYSVEGQSLNYTATRFIGAQELFPVIMNDSGERLRFISRLQSDSLEFNEIRFDILDAGKAIGGDPNQLLTDWGNKLDLKLDDAGDVVVKSRVESGGFGIQ